MTPSPKLTILWTAIGAVVGLMVLVLRPVPQTNKDNAIVISGTVQKIFEGGDKDVVFSLRENEQIYYINRGLAQGLDLSDLQYRLIGREVSITYPNYWTPLDWNSRIHHLSRLQLGEEIIYDETNGLELSTN
ncbi:MAG: hypothetical protein AAF927_25050 [Bacteroidota bacterium]